LVTAVFSANLTNVCQRVPARTPPKVPTLIAWQSKVLAGPLEIRFAPSAALHLEHPGPNLLTDGRTSLKFQSNYDPQVQKPRFRSLFRSLRQRFAPRLECRFTICWLIGDARHTFELVDAIVTPTSPIAPSPISAFDAAYKDPSFPNDRNDIRRPVLRNTSPFDKYGLPTVSVPCGFARAGLLIGLQIAGAPGQDAVVLRLAHPYEQASDWHRRMPKTF
jgi:Asp-tRNA(Asn)/Glu-tRNA(Gln) amidotransferase A subunit family amidase